jgi:hypothetical protein
MLDARRDNAMLERDAPEELYLQTRCENASVLGRALQYLDEAYHASLRDAQSTFWS